MAKKFKISEIKPIITNLAQSSHYQVIFGGLPTELLRYLSVRNVQYSFIAENAGLLCSSASLPTGALKTKSVDGNYTGIQENVATARMFGEITLEFYVDADYRSLIFLESWVEYISSGSHNNISGTLPSIRQNVDGYFVRMQYPDTYKSNMTKIVKFDRDYSYFREIEYTFVGLFPYQIYQVPVSYNGSEILKVSAAFKYDRYIAGRALSLNYSTGNANNNQPNNPNNAVYNRTGQSLGNESGVRGTIYQPGNVNPIILR